MEETLGEKVDFWYKEIMKVNEKKRENQYRKTATKEEKIEKRKKAAHYELRLAKIREITDTIEHLTELERDF